jgi:hypothetical protein
MCSRCGGDAQGWYIISSEVGVRGAMGVHGVGCSTRRDATVLVGDNDTYMAAHKRAVLGDVGADSDGDGAPRGCLHGTDADGDGCILRGGAGQLPSLMKRADGRTLHHEDILLWRGHPAMLCVSSVCLS